NPGELLGVVAHEAGHVKNRHTLRDGAQGAGMQPMLMTMALGALAIAAGAPDAGAVLLGNSQYFGTLSALRYMTHQEGEADNTGARALERAGLSGRGLVSFFENFRSQEVFSDARRFPYFRSHPLSSDRIENLRRLVREQPHYAERDSEARLAQHALILAKIHAFMDAPNFTLRDYPETDVSLPARYARAIAWYRDGQTERALSAVDVLLQEQPENPYFWELRGQILFEEGRPAEAIGAHQRAVDIKPDAPLLRINLAHALIETRDPEKLETAVTHLRRATSTEKDNTLGWRLLSQAYASQGKEGEARLASAEMYFAMGAERQATQFALRARDMLDPGSAEWTRAMDIVFASGATQDDVDDLDRRNERNRPVVIPPAAG
ncbi:MAG: M48 family peptidase, partial [Caulobacteraceae bacterium]